MDVAAAGFFGTAVPPIAAAPGGGAAPMAFHQAIAALQASMPTAGPGANPLMPGTVPASALTLPEPLIQPAIAAPLQTGGPPLATAAVMPGRAQLVLIVELAAAAPRIRGPMVPMALPNTPLPDTPLADPAMPAASAGALDLPKMLQSVPQQARAAAVLPPVKAEAQPPAEAPPRIAAATPLARQPDTVRATAQSPVTSKATITMDTLPPEPERSPPLTTEPVAGPGHRVIVRANARPAGGTPASGPSEPAVMSVTLNTQLAVAGPVPVSTEVLTPRLQAAAFRGAGTAPPTPIGTSHAGGRPTIRRPTVRSAPKLPEFGPASEVVAAVSAPVAQILAVALSPTPPLQAAPTGGNSSHAVADVLDADPLRGTVATPLMLGGAADGTHPATIKAQAIAAAVPAAPVAASPGVLDAIAPWAAPIRAVDTGPGHSRLPIPPAAPPETPATASTASFAGTVAAASHQPITVRVATRQSSPAQMPQSAGSLAPIGPAIALASATSRAVTPVATAPRAGGVLPPTTGDAAAQHIAPAEIELTAVLPQAPVPAATGEPKLPVPAAESMAYRVATAAYDTGVLIARRVTAGSDEVSIRMEPAELGRIDVRMSFDDGGKLRATVSSDSPVILDLLRRDVAHLTTAMTDAGISSDQRSFRFEAPADNNSGARSWSSSGDQPREQRQSPERQPGAPSSPDEPDPGSFQPIRWAGQINVTA